MLSIKKHDIKKHDQIWPKNFFDEKLWPKTNFGRNAFDQADFQQSNFPTLFRVRFASLRLGNVMIKYKKNVRNS